jgi:8-oxo-dGTP diphosphatase
LKGDAGWELPGGRLENDDTWEEGLIREIREETGIQKVEDIQPVELGLSDSKETYMVYFICKVFGETVIQLSPEHTEYAWIDTHTLDKWQFAHPKTKEKIELALKAI